MTEGNPHWQYARFEKGTRFYTIILHQDLLGDWIITRVNGRVGSRLGQVRHEVHHDFKASISRYDALCHYRQDKRDYHQAAAVYSHS